MIQSANNLISVFADIDMLAYLHKYTKWSFYVEVMFAASIDFWIKERVSLVKNQLQSFCFAVIKRLMDIVRTQRQVCHTGDILSFGQNRCLARSTCFDQNIAASVM